MGYIDLHSHSTGSCMNTGKDGSGKIAQRVRRAVELGMPALGLTDHGNIFGLLEHYAECTKNNIKSLMGIEAYHLREWCVPPTLKEKREQGMSDVEYEAAKTKAKHNHLTLFAMNNQGYSNICTMLTIASKHFYHFHPVFPNELLADYADGIICFSGCIQGYIAQHILSDEAELAWEQVKFFQAIYGDRFYFEVMPHAVPGQEDVNRQLEVWSEWPGNNIRIVATNDTHYVYRRTYPQLQVFHELRKASKGVDYEEMAMNSEEEMVGLFWENMHWDRAKSLKYLHTAGEVAERCNVTFSGDGSTRSAVLDMPEVPGIDDQYDELERRCKRGLIEKRKFYVGKDGKKHALPDYGKRLQYELKILRDKAAEGINFAGYLLLAASFADHAKEVGYETQGRGSVCNWLVTWLLGIHKLDPIRYNLDPDRFISPVRTTIPDVDTDVPDIMRDELLRWMGQTYGEIAPIANFTTYKSKTLTSSLVKILGIENGKAKTFQDEIARANPLDGTPVYKDVMQNLLLADIDREYGAVKVYCFAHGQMATVSTHAAGVVLSKGKLTDKLAIVRSHGDGDEDEEKITYTACYDNSKGLIESVLGLPKFDVLGVKTLTVAQEAERHAGVQYTDRILTPEERADRSNHTPFLYDDKDLQDPFVMAMLHQGRTHGLMQLETSVPLRLCKQFKPTTVEDVAIISALNRPSGKDIQLADVILWKTSKAKKPIIFQEDIMALCRTAGLLPAQIDRVLKTMKGKAKSDPEMHDQFVAGIQANAGYTAEQAEQQWQDFQVYGFMKGHAMAYAHLALRQAWLKHYHNFSFWLATLRHAKKEQRAMYEVAAVHDGIKLLPPNVNGYANYGEVCVEAFGNNSEECRIQLGLATIDGVGPKRAEEIVALRGDGYTSREDTLKKVPKRVLNVAVEKALDDADALQFSVPMQLVLGNRLTEERASMQLRAIGDDPEKYRKKYRKNGGGTKRKSA